MKYFIIFALLAYLAVIFYMPLLRHFVKPTYWAGLGVIPVVMMAEVFMGVYSNLSFWYKLTDQTHWGAIMSAVGAVVMIGINTIFVPEYGYWACSWGGFFGYAIPMLMSYFIGRKKYPVEYDMKSIASFTVLAAVLFLASRGLEKLGMGPVALMACNTVLLAVYMVPVAMPLLKKLGAH